MLAQRIKQKHFSCLRVSVCLDSSAHPKVPYTGNFFVHFLSGASCIFTNHACKLAVISVRFGHDVAEVSNAFVFT